ncbi:sugar-binding protein [Streptomyces sp. LX-29]|uniref:polymorphic toxin-type HINT domain-containing protein n=1 Tax=Streptomyces sp. LX-29 TaxID=2900152 RepID=UPI00240E1B02|nr:polymorphic toxin-type HINT domain-containing protein [Streptomyces sp. LX-29]WFB07933.1 sugar-binding protein [Streptomyces sp. LX-29]
MLDRKDTARAGVDGLLFTLTPQAQDKERPAAGDRTAVSVDYSAFEEAFGGGYASRLRLMELPSCALTTPDKAECRNGKPVPTVNDQEKRTLTAAAVPLHTSRVTVLAAAAGEQSEKGDYKATSLSPAAAWETDLNTGDFGWSYEMPAPAVPGSLIPKVGLSYSSGSIDGRTGGTNNQASWVGDGFDLGQGFIERRYKPCADDGVKNGDGTKPGDLCWGYENAYMSFNGKSGELVPAGKDEWKLKQDDGTKVKRLSGSARGNGDNDNEYWRVTDPDGTKYYFGYHKLNGWTAGKPATDSVWTVPVYGDDSGEPCNAGSFSGSWCQQAWRWNLDYVVDTHGNAMAYYYDKEANSYGRNLKSEDDTPYTRGGHLDRIEYGLQYTDLYANKPLAKVTFTNAERCLPQSGVTCAADTIDGKAQYWYDTPWDLNCKAGTKCDRGRLSPTFWTRKRLTEVTTQVLKDGAYAKVDSWKLGHRWGMADVDYQLLLDSIQHTGHTGTAPITLPPTTFAYTSLTNRLDKTGDGMAPFVKARVATVADEAGGQIDVAYSGAACSRDDLPTPQSNTTRCFPQYIGGDASDDPTRQWFNKYVVDSVTTTDRTGGSPDQVTRYSYLGGAAWHFDDDEGLTKEKHKTWSQWRGYGHVRVQTGGQGTNAMKSQEDTYFLRGMHGDRKGTSKEDGTKEVQVSLGEGEGAPITDHESTAGFAYKTVSYSAPGGKALAKEVSRPWHHETAKRERSWGTLTANLTGASHTRTFTSLDDGAGDKWRTNSTATSHDTVAGRVTRVDDLGDDSTAKDDRCTRTTYADNAGANLLTLVSQVETVAVRCELDPARKNEVISDVRTAYDGGGYGDAPTKGDVTATATLKEHDGTKATYLESGTTYDSYGRQLTATDLTTTVTVAGDGAPSRTARNDSRTTTTVYTPATGFPTRSTVTTPPAKRGDKSTEQTTTTELETLRGMPTAEVDTNGKRTEFAYDALGRSTKVWLADRRSTQLPSYEFGYTVKEGQPVAVRTLTLDTGGSGQVASYTLYDGLLRQRQTQTPGPGGGRILTDTFYDERGLTSRRFAAYYTAGTPGELLFKPEDALSVETQSRHTYDGLGRETEAKQISGNGDGGQVLAVTRTVYGGDRTTVIPPRGGTVTTTLTDGRGRTTELRQYHGDDIGSAYDKTSYDYTAAGQLEKVTDPDGNFWAFSYDQLGRQIEQRDPDRGTTSSTYNDRGELTLTSDARDSSVAYVYDDLGRRTEARDGEPSGKPRAKWVYDTVNGAKGQLTEAIRYVDGAAYSSQITEYDRLYRPTKTAIVIPEKEGALAGTYKAGSDYYANGLVRGTEYSAAGSLAGGGLGYEYEDRTQRPIKVTDGDGMTATTAYSLTGKPLQYELGGTSMGGRKTWVTNTYEWGTQRLSTSRVDRQDVPGVDQFATYGYDQIGNVTSVSDTSRSGTDTQCFAYDYLRRLTEAWTQPTKTCSSAPPADGIGGPAPYWLSYTYDKVGNRRTETHHDPSGDTAKNTVRTYDYPPAGKPKPHALSSVTTRGPAGDALDRYTYDEVGNTKTRTMGGDQEDLSWDVEGHLAKVTKKAGGTTTTTSYLYDADGTRLIGRTPTETTLYLGHTELTLAKGATKPKATRYADLGGGNQAVRGDDDKVSLTLADHHGTAQLAVDGPSFELSQRRTAPFGATRGDQPKTWPGMKGFVGGTIDTTTGLTHLGAREYDPGIGRFISVDPVLDVADPQQVNGYAYSNNNPLTFSDPTGLLFGGGLGGIFDRAKAGFERATRAASKVVRYVAYHPQTSIWLSQRSISASVQGKAKKLAPDAGELARMEYRSGLRGGKMSLGYGADVDALAEERTRENAYKDDPAWMAVAKATFKAAIPLMSIADCYSTRSGDACAQAGVDMVGLNKARLAARGIGAAADAATGRSKKRGSCDSFLPGADVLLAGGTRKNIEDVEVGDKVTATDPETGETTTREVVATIVTEDDKDFTDLTIATESGEASIIATDHHPFWSPSAGEWVDAGDLEPGMTLRTSEGDTVSVKGARHFEKRQRTHNLTVDDLHTYYVLAGATPVLVHNDGGEPVTDDFNQARNQALDWLISRGFKAEKVTLGKFGTIRGKPVGMQTANGKAGFRIEFDDRSGAHINVWAGKEKGPHFQFNATEATVTKLQGLHGCG